jgi:hypothetical protein
MMPLAENHPSPLGLRRRMRQDKLARTGCMPYRAA